eukprot:m.38291 g.38291  ORF g.38291 m.38291 type:complete len:74 (-) comp13369_c0_seq1:3136-3357(-)
MPMFQFLFPAVTDPGRFANVTSRLFTAREWLCFKSISRGSFPLHTTNVGSGLNLEGVRVLFSRDSAGASNIRI